MAQQVFHLVGKSGSGKTTLAVAMAHWHARKGSVCMLVDELEGVSEFDVEKGDFYYTGSARPEKADVLFVEHLRDEGFTDGKPGHTVVRITTVPEGA